MITTDDFKIIVPATGEPRFATQTDIVDAVARGQFRTTKTAALLDGRSISGSVYWERPKDASADLAVMFLLAERFQLK